MPIFAVHYRYQDDSVAARDAHRPAHRAFLGTLASAPAHLVASGPYAQDPPGALLVIHAASSAEVRTALDADPFMIEGLIADRQIREWTQVVGPWVS